MRQNAPLGPSLKAVDRDAALTSIMTGATDPFMIPYALALGASHFEVALLSSVRNLVLAIVQLWSSDAVRRLGSRKSLVLWSAGLQALLWLPLSVAEPLFGSFAVAALIACYTLGTASAALGSPAWGSLIADFVPPEERGRFFGRRARLSGVSSSVAAATAGGLLQLAQGRTALGFGALCALAGASRALAWRALSRVHDSPWKDDPEVRFSFMQFLRATPRSNFARFSLCIAAHSFASNLASPYFAVYLLDGLGYSYAAYTFVMLCGSLAGIFCGPLWGRIGDQTGNHALLRRVLFCVAPVPMLWLVSSHPLWMAAVNASAGFMWGGLLLCAANFTYDAVTPAKRHTCIAYFNVLSGIGVSLGALAGGLLVRVLGTGETPFVLLFATSMALRAATALAFLRWVREVREVGPLTIAEVISDLLGPRLLPGLGRFAGRRGQGSAGDTATEP